MTQLENRPISESPNHSMSTVGVVGAGTMGNGVAHVFARSGYSVVLCDVEQRFLERGLDRKSVV